jgi:DNA invertase Pin-like site-specific DNA recombinase
MDTSLERIRAKIAELETKLADLRIAERELQALEKVPARSFNTTSSMGRLTLNVLLSFARFEREVIGERVRDKIAASKRKGLWVGRTRAALVASTRTAS